MLVETNIRELKIDFKYFFKKMMHEKRAPFGAYIKRNNPRFVV